MALQYKVWSDEELQNRNLVPEGDYGFRITSCDEKVSKSGNDMTVFGFEFKDQKGQIKNIREHVLMTEDWDWKIKVIAKATGLTAKYDNKTLDRLDFVGKTGRFTIGQKVNNNDGLMQNVIKKYSEKATQQAQAAPKAQDDDFVDDKDIAF